jgi:hypothetical protein
MSSLSMQHYLMLFSMTPLDMLLALIIASPIFLLAAYGLMKLGKRWEEPLVEAPKEGTDELPMYFENERIQELQEIRIPPPAYEESVPDSRRSIASNPTLP